MGNDPRHELGSSAEDRAAAFLTTRGYEIEERNFSCKLGEVDIVARKGDTLVFVEVRSRTNSGRVHPAATVTRRKQQQIVKTAMVYCQDHRITDIMIRFDVVAVMEGGKKIELIENAFEAGR